MKSLSKVIFLLSFVLLSTLYASEKHFYVYRLQGDLFIRSSPEIVNRPDNRIHFEGGPLQFNKGQEIEGVERIQRGSNQWLKVSFAMPNGALSEGWILVTNQRLLREEVLTHEEDNVYADLSETMREFNRFLQNDGMGSPVSCETEDIKGVHRPINALLSRSFCFDYDFNQNLDSSQLVAFLRQEYRRNPISNLNEEDFIAIQMLARTLLSEAGNRPIHEIKAVAGVIRNRVQSGRYPNSFAGVVTQRQQFSGWDHSSSNRGRGGHHHRIACPSSHDSRFLEKLEVAFQAVVERENFGLNPRVTMFFSPNSLPRRARGNTPAQRQDNNGKIPPELYSRVFSQRLQGTGGRPYYLGYPRNWNWNNLTVDYPIYVEGIEVNPRYFVFIRE